MGQHPSLKPASLRSRTLGSTLRLPTPLVSFGRPSLFGAAVANTRDKSPRTIQHRPACLVSSHIQIQYPSGHSLRAEASVCNQGSAPWSGRTVAEEERDPVQFALCFHSTLAVMPSAHTHPTPLMPL